MKILFVLPDEATFTLTGTPSGEITFTRFDGPLMGSQFDSVIVLMPVWVKSTALQSMYDEYVSDTRTKLIPGGVFLKLLVRKPENLVLEISKILVEISIP